MNAHFEIAPCAAPFVFAACSRGSRRRDERRDEHHRGRPHEPFRQGALGVVVAK